MPRAAVVRLDVAGWATCMNRPPLRIDSAATACCCKRVRVLYRALRIDRPIAAVKRNEPELFQPSEDAAHARDCSGVSELR